MKTFPKEFVDEIKNYFERSIIKNKDTTKNKKIIEELKKDEHFKKEKIKEYKNHIVFEGHYSWKEDNKMNIFGDIKPTAVSEGLRYQLKLNKINNENLTPMHIRRLCFTRLKKVFSLEDQDLFYLWNQHKVGIVDSAYITDHIKSTIKYFEENKIQNAVLIGDIVKITKKNEEFQKKIDKIEKLETKISEIKETMKKYSKIIEKFENLKDL